MPARFFILCLALAGCRGFGADRSDNEGAGDPLPPTQIGGEDDVARGDGGGSDDGNDSSCDFEPPSTDDDCDILCGDDIGNDGVRAYVCDDPVRVHAWYMQDDAVEELNIDRELFITVKTVTNTYEVFDSNWNHPGSPEVVEYVKLCPADCGDD